MAFENGTDVLTCTVCGAQHKARWERLPVRDDYKVNCYACGTTMASGKGVKDYFDVRLVDEV